MHHSFTLDGRDAWIAFLDFVRRQARDYNHARGRPLQVTITDETEGRSQQQNRKLWQMLRSIAEQAEIQGRRFSAEVWLEHLARQFLGCEDVILPGGEIITRRASTSGLTVQQFSFFLDEIDAYAVGELGVTFADD